MTFGQPLWFWAFAIFPVLIAVFFQNEARRVKLLRKLVAARLQDRLAGSVNVAKRRLRFVVILLGMACVIAALAQPRLGYTWEQSQRKGRDVLIAIDCSKSMLATDLAPNRLGRAKLAANDLISQLQGDRVGIIAFAGRAFLQAPLTVDYGAVLNSLAEIDTDIIPRGGTDIAAAIKGAVDAFGKGESDNRALILFTDGEELDEDGVKAAEEQNGTIKIFTVGIGSNDGSLIPIPGRNGGTDFVKDENGQIVKSRIDEERLRKIAEATGGFYVHLVSGPAEMQQIVRDGLGKMKEQDIDAKMSRRPIERYQWPLAAGMALLASSLLIGERKRAARRDVAPRKALAVALVMASALFAPALAQARNEGIEAYEQKDYKRAEEHFTRQLQRLPDSEALHFDIGAAAYKAGDFAKALDSFAKAVTSPDPRMHVAAEYNLGNTLYQRGAALQDKQPKIREWKNALQHYDEALKIEPQNKDARYNRDLVQRLIDELEKEPPKSDDKKQQDQQNEKKKNEENEQQKQPKSGDNKSDKNENPQDNKKQDQQQQQQQQQNQKSQGDQKQPQNQPQDGSQKTGEQGKEDQKNGQQEPSQKNSGKGDEKRDAKNDPSKSDQDGQQAKNERRDQGDKKDQQPSPAPNGSEKKKTGDIKAQGEQQAQNEAQREEAEEALAAEEGNMTAAQAKSLLDSLKGEDSRVQLLKPGERRAGGRVLKDW
jgi:Ca-activated chloride channel family protein